MLLHGINYHNISKKESEIVDFFNRTNKEKRFKDFPVVIYQDYMEHSDLLGCHMSGLSYFYIDSMGNVTPCVFYRFLLVISWKRISLIYIRE